MIKLGDYGLFYHDGEFVATGWMGHVFEDPNVFENAVQNVRQQLREYGARDIDEWALRKIAFTYYYD